jgi:hypothetical protein
MRAQRGLGVDMAVIVRGGVGSKVCSTVAVEQEAKPYERSGIPSRAGAVRRAKIDFGAFRP